MPNGIRRLAMLAAALLLAAGLPGMALAAGAETLVIDTGNRYEGMNKTWGQGYLPTVSGSTATVVLPLVLNPQSGVMALKEDTVTVSPDYGSPSSSPFVFNNLEAKVMLVDHAVNGGPATARAWLLSFSFALAKYRVNGAYPLTFHVGYTLPDGTAATQDFTVYVTIHNGINPNATAKPAATPKPTPKPQPQPKLIVSRYAVSPDIVAAGTGFTLDFDIQNTSDTVAVRNIKVTVKGEGPDLTPVEGSNTLYVKSLDHAATAPLSFAMTARYDAESKPQKVTIAIDYEDGDGTAYSASDELLVQVTQNLRVEFDKPGIPAAVTAGDTVPVSLNVFNMGRTKLYNVMCRVKAPGLLPEGSAFLGNMEPGSGKTAEMYVYVGTRDMSLSDDGEIVTDAGVTDQYGGTAGFITVEYEDEFGNRMNDQVELKATINRPVVQASAPPPEETGPEIGQWWIAVVAAGAVILGITAVTLALRRKRARELAGDHETD